MRRSPGPRDQDGTGWRGERGNSCASRFVPSRCECSGLGPPRSRVVAARQIMCVHAEPVLHRVAGTCSPRSSALPTAREGIRNTTGDIDPGIGSPKAAIGPLNWIRSIHCLVHAEADPLCSSDNLLGRPVGRAGFGTSSSPPHWWVAYPACRRARRSVSENTILPTVFGTGGPPTSFPGAAR